ncbi:hypothetical protein MP228_000402 [Amoeboaphelidium protococcarum]|nr:hypothetical protein MP228_000402 [Amoeboaphelidium protococcarum]
MDLIHVPPAHNDIAFCYMTDGIEILVVALQDMKIKNKIRIPAGQTVCCITSHLDQIYIAIGDSVYVYDGIDNQLRDASINCIESSNGRDMEIAAMCALDSGHLVVGMDDGSVRCYSPHMNLTRSQVAVIQTNIELPRHSGTRLKVKSSQSHSPLLTAVCAMPGTADQFLSCGFDQTIRQWRIVGNSVQLIDSVSIQENNSIQDQYFHNPPYLYCMDTHHGLLAVGDGQSRVRIFKQLQKFSKFSKWTLEHLIDCRSDMIVVVRFLSDRHVLIATNAGQLFHFAITRKQLVAIDYLNSMSSATLIERPVDQTTPLQYKINDCTYSAECKCVLIATTTANEIIKIPLSL